MPTPYDNFNLTQSRYIPQYHGAPIKEFGDLLAKREADYQKNVSVFDQVELAASNLNVNDADYAVKKQALDDVRGQIQQIADEGGGYEFAGVKARQVARNFIGNEGLKSAVQNQIKIKEETAKLEQNYRDEKISYNAYMKGLSTLGEYTGIGEGENGVFNSPETYAPVNYVDIATSLDTFGKGWKEEQRVTPQINPATGVTGLYSEKTDRYINASEVREGMKKRINSDSEMKSYVEEEARLTGQTVDEIISPMIEAQVSKLGFHSSGTAIKGIPNFSANGTKPSSPGSKATYQQTVGASGNKIAAEGATGITKRKKETATTIEDLTNTVNTTDDTTPQGKQIKEAAKLELELATKQLEDLEELENRIQTKVEEKWGKSFEDLSPELLEAVEKQLAIEYTQKESESISFIGSIGGAPSPKKLYTIGGSDFYMNPGEYEAYKAENENRVLAEKDPMYAEYNQILKESGQTSSLDTPVFMAEDLKERKNLDDIAKRIFMMSNSKENLGESGDELPVGFFLAQGPNQGVQVHADTHGDIAELMYAGEGVSRNGESVIYFNAYDADGKVVEGAGKIYTNDKAMTASGRARISADGLEELAITGKILKIGQTPLKTGILGTSELDTGVVVTHELEIINNASSSKLDIQTKARYKITSTDPTRGSINHYYGSIEELKINLKELNLNYN